MNLVTEIMTQLGCTEALTREYIKLAITDIQTFDRKQRDYGAENRAL